jgi:hypothetical protein
VAGSLVSSALAPSPPSGGGGGGGGGQNPFAPINTQSLGQTMTGILGGGVGAALGIQGLSGGNANQLQAGASAANPFGQYASGFVPQLQGMLQGGLQNMGNTAQNNEFSFLNNIMGNQYIGTNTGALGQMGNISTPGATGAMQGMVNNPTQLLGSLQGGGMQAAGGIQNILGQNPYAFTPGEQFQYQTGLNTLQGSMAQQGLVGSGQQMLALQDYGQREASTATQQNINNLFGAQSQATNIFGANQGLQGILSQMGQNQFGNAMNLGQFQGNQQQASFSNQLGTQQLQATQQQNTAQNLGNMLTRYGGIFSNNINAQEALLSPLLTATQASSSSPGTAGSILANLSGANAGSANQLGSGLGALGNGLGNMLSGLNFGGGSSYAGDFSTGGGYTAPGSYISGLGGPNGFTPGYTYSGDNSYGFTMP